MNSSALHPAGSPTALRDGLRRLALYAVLGLVALYGLGVTAGYVWLRYVRKSEQIAFTDVALFRVRAVQRSIAAQHLAKAQGEWAAKNYQAAYLSFSSAVQLDPDNIPARLAAADFFRTVGATAVGSNLLEAGLARAPGDRRLIEPTFDLLLATNRARHALELLHRLYGASPGGANALLLQTYEVQATFKADGAEAAKKLLGQYPQLLKHPAAVLVVARVRWESAERLKAIRLLEEYVRTQPGDAAAYVQLAGWQEAGGLPGDAVQTARRAVAQFSGDTAPRVLLIEMLAATSPGAAAMQAEIAAYLRDFVGRPESLTQLAALAGREGWVDLARTLYEVGANRQPDLGLLALYYSDALARSSRVKEARSLLEQIEAQVTEGSAAFLVQLRQRQVIAAAATGDHDGAREYTRRLAATLQRDPEGLEICRRNFQKLGITEAVAELTARSGPTRVAVQK